MRKGIDDSCAAETLAGRIREKFVGGTHLVSVDVHDGGGALGRGGGDEPFKQVGDSLGNGGERGGRLS
jgi:hypothetical protein